MRVPPALRSQVFARDQQCVLAKLDATHVCRDTWGQPHLSTRLDLLTIEHVKTELRMGVRAPNDLEHLLTLCAYSNVNVPSKAEREAFRAYLIEVNEGVPDAR